MTRLSSHSALRAARAARHGRPARQGAAGGGRPVQAVRLHPGAVLAVVGAPLDRRTHPRPGGGEGRRRGRQDRPARSGRDQRAGGERHPPGARARPGGAQGRAEGQGVAAYAERGQGARRADAAVNQSPAGRAATAQSLGRLDTATSNWRPRWRPATTARSGPSGDCSGWPTGSTTRPRTCAPVGRGAAERAGPRPLAGQVRRAPGSVPVGARRHRPGGGRQGFAGMVAAWSDAVTLLGRARAVPPAVTAQSVRVDTLHRRLAARAGRVPQPGSRGGASRRPRRSRPFAFAAGPTPGPSRG
jgi:hypothetical protein